MMTSAFKMMNCALKDPMPDAGGYVLLSLVRILYLK